MRITKWSEMAQLTIREVMGDENTDDADKFIQERVFIHFTNGDVACVKAFADSHGDADVRLVNEEGK